MSKSPSTKPRARTTDQPPTMGTRCPTSGRDPEYRVPRVPAGHYLLRLFMAGNGANSQKALANLRSLCQEHLAGRHTIETVDVVQDFEAAVQNNILVTPALILVAPLPRVVVLGNLSDLPTVLAALRLSEGDV